MLDTSVGDLSLPLLEHLPVGVIVYQLEDPADDWSLKLIGFNAPAAKMTRADFGKLLGLRIRDAFPSVDPQRVAMYAQLARDGSRRDMGETTYGDPAIERSTFLVTAAGVAPRTVAVFIENTSALKRATAFLDAIIENLPNMVFVKEAKELRFERFNRAGEKLLGLERKSLLGKNDYDFFPPDQAKFFQDRDRATLAAKEVLDIPEEPIKTAAGERWLHTRKVPILDADGTPRYLLGISEDITEHKQAADAMRELVARLEESNTELDSFTYSVSHDLRAPLRAIDGFSRMLLEDHSEKLGDEGRRVAAVITRNAVKMGQLIDDLLAFARLGRKQIEKHPVDMGALVRAVADEVRVPERVLEFRIGAMPKAAGDAALLKQVWVNLMSNAVKYSRGKPTALIEVSGETREGFTVYTVKDNGVGFDERYRAKLFGVFQRLHAANEYEGTGVGLALVQRIVQRHGGWVKAESVLGEGATFMFGLPA